jgi:hypothetical protein
LGKIKQLGKEGAGGVIAGTEEEDRGEGEGGAFAFDGFGDRGGQAFATQDFADAL